MSTSTIGSMIAGREAAQHVDTPVERRELHDEAQPVGIDGDGEEHAAEEEHRRGHHGHHVEVLPLAHPGRGGHAHRCRGQAHQERSRDGQDGRRREDQAEQRHDQQEADGVDEAARQRPAHLSDRHVGGTQWRGQDGVEGLGVLELEEEVEGRFHERPVHGGRGHEPGRHVGRVGDVTHVAHEHPQAEADAQQVEDRLEEPGDDDRPVAPIDEDVALEDLVGAPAAQRPRREETGRDQHGGRVRLVIRSASG